MKKRAGNKCEVCGKTKRLNAHHIVSKSNRSLCYDPRNGVALCPCHHILCNQSAHKDPYWFVMEWLPENRAEDLEYIRKHKDKKVEWTVEKILKVVDKLKKELS